MVHVQGVWISRTKLEPDPNDAEIIKIWNVYKSYSVSMATTLYLTLSLKATVSNYPFKKRPLIQTQL